MTRLKIARRTETDRCSEIETVRLTHAQFEQLASMSRDINPEMPVAFGSAHAVRTLLERCEEAGIDADAILPLTTG
ncbi:MAG: hypothetical protein JJE51_07650 [Thermoanaerobaculia bacterium]|nr:hypothetical protein [Thermoanaerobaculia bacterium]